jgi:hypothetical protein
MGATRVMGILQALTASALVLLATVAPPALPAAGCCSAEDSAAGQTALR